MKVLKKVYVLFLKKLELGSAVAVRLTKLTGKSEIPIHPKHFLTKNPWFTNYISKKDVVLDLGCGNGQNTFKAAKKAKKVIGVELDDALLKFAKKTATTKKLQNVIFTKADLEKRLKYKSDYFNKVLFLDVLEHLLNRNQILDEIKRVLKPGGLLFLGVPNKETSWKKIQRAVGVCSYSDPDHKIEYSGKEISNLLNSHKFKIRYFGYGKFDTPLRGIFVIIGSISIPLYKKITKWREELTKKNPNEASGFEIVAANRK